MKLSIEFFYSLVRHPILNPRVVAIFDFDHTITSWDTAARFIVWLIRRSIWKCGLVLVALPVLSPLIVFRSTRKVPVGFSAWAATLGVSLGQLHDLARAHILEVTDRGEAFVRKDALARIKHHLSNGHEVVVATGCVEVLAREILLAEGLNAVTVVGSSVRMYLGGMVVLEHCFGERKIPMLASRGFNPPWDFAYSDHQADLPMLLQGKERYLVNPRPSCSSKLTAALGETAQVVSWK